VYVLNGKEALPAGQAQHPALAALGRTRGGHAAWRPVRRDAPGRHMATSLGLYGSEARSSSCGHSSAMTRDRIGRDVGDLHHHRFVGGAMAKPCARGLVTLGTVKNWPR
jgi:hypothetical protein